MFWTGDATHFIYSTSIDRSMCQFEHDKVQKDQDHVTPCGFCKQVVVKVGFLYSAAYAMTGPARFIISEVAVDWQIANGAAVT